MILSSGLCEKSNATFKSIGVLSTSSDISGVWFKSYLNDWPPDILFPCRKEEILSIRWILIQAFSICMKTWRGLRNVRWLSLQQTCNHRGANQKSYLNISVAMIGYSIYVSSRNAMQDWNWIEIWIGIENSYRQWLIEDFSQGLPIFIFDNLLTKNIHKCRFFFTGLCIVFINDSFDACHCIFAQLICTFHPLLQEKQR